MATPAKQPVRNHIFHEITRSLCPECRRVIDAQVLIRDGAVYLRKRCPEHGWHEALVWSDGGGKRGPYGQRQARPLRLERGTGRSDARLVSGDRRPARSRPDQRR